MLTSPFGKIPIRSFKNYDNTERYNCAVYIILIRLILLFGPFDIQTKQVTIY